MKQTSILDIGSLTIEKRQEGVYPLVLGDFDRAISAKLLSLLIQTLLWLVVYAYYASYTL